MPGRESVVVVVVDALRRDHVGCYEEGPNRLTPAIDDIASDGIVAEQATSTTNATEPAMLSMLSGRHPTQTMLNHGTQISEKERRRAWGTPLSPKRLQESGYYTIQTGRGLGRWFSAGFNVYQDPIEMWTQTTQSPREKLLSSVETTIGRALHRISPSLGARIGNLYRDAAREDVDPIADLITALNEAPMEQPVFALTHLMDTHAGYEPADEHLPADPATVNTGRPLSELADEFGIETPTGERMDYFARKHADMVSPVREGLIDALYRGTVKTTDDRIQQLVDGIRSLKMLDDTWLIILADHGESLTEHGIYHDHHGLYEATVRIPLVIRPPGGSEEPKRTDELIQINDIAPTLLDIAETPETQTFSKSIEGRSLMPLLRGDPSAWNSRPAALADETYTQRRAMIRTSSSKLLYVPDDGKRRCRYCDSLHGDLVELYDLDDDPDEQQNRIVTELNRAAELKELDGQLRTKFHPKPTPVDVEADAEEREALNRQLESLGYR